MHLVAKSWFLTAVLLLIASPVLAQHGFRKAMPPPAPARFVAPHPLPARLPVTPMIRRITVSNPASSSGAPDNSSTTGSDSVVFNGSPISLDDLLDPSPSFGFNFEHLNAVNPDLGIKALIDPITQERLAIAERLLRETPSGAFSFPFLFGQPGVALEEQPPVIVLQQPSAMGTAAREVITPASAPAPAENTQEPLHDVGTFELVLRDGTRLSAIAFTIRDNRLIYITSDGLRRTIPASELDKTATIQLNDERATPVHLPE